MIKAIVIFVTGIVAGIPENYKTKKLSTYVNFNNI